MSTVIQQLDGFWDRQRQRQEQRKAGEERRRLAVLRRIEQTEAEVEPMPAIPKASVRQAWSVHEEILQEAWSVHEEILQEERRRTYARSL